jgi:hypothetical protein
LDPRRIVIADFLKRQYARNWATPALIALALILLVFVLAGEQVNAPFVYSQPT